MPAPIAICLRLSRRHAPNGAHSFARAYAHDVRVQALKPETCSPAFATEKKSRGIVRNPAAPTMRASQSSTRRLAGLHRSSNVLGDALSLERGFARQEFLAERHGSLRADQLFGHRKHLALFFGDMMLDQLLQHLDLRVATLIVLVELEQLPTEL